jgi:hypothetical protein
MVNGLNPVFVPPQRSRRDDPGEGEKGMEVVAVLLYSEEVSRVWAHRNASPW